MVCFDGQVGEKLGKFEVEKRQAVENEDYDKAKLKKVHMDEYRIQVYKDLHVHNLLEIDGVCIGIKYILLTAPRIKFIVNLLTLERIF